METLKNLVKAFIGESQARNRYSFYAKKAKQEGYEQVAEIFLITAEQEKEHAKVLYELINELKEKSKESLEELKVEVTAPLKLARTASNLKAAIEGETYEYSEMYPAFAEQAEKEGFHDIAARLKAIAQAERHHAERFAQLLKRIEQGFFKRNEEVEWICRKCGYLHKGKEAPAECPSCGHPQAYFEIREEKY